MRKRAQNSNKQFLIGTAAMAFAVGAVVVIFLFLCAQHMKNLPIKESYKDIYQIEFTKGFSGQPAIVYLNDSLVWDAIVPSDTTRLRIHRFKPFARRCRIHFWHRQEGWSHHSAKNERRQRFNESIGMVNQEAVGTANTAA